MKTNTWTTAKGTEVMLVTEHVTEDTINADGHKVTVKADRIEILKVIVGGEEQTARLTTYEGKKVLHLGHKTINGKKHPLMALIPDNVYQEVWGEYDARQKAAFEAEMEAERKYQEHYKKVTDAMAE